MATNATAIRDAILSRAQAAGTWQTARATDMPTLSGADLPALQVLLLSERLTPRGDANNGPPKFVADATIGISVLRGFADPTVLDGSADSDCDVILDALLTDGTFVSAPKSANYWFEGITAINRRRMWIEQGEAYFLELRLEITLEYPQDFPPVMPNFLEEIDLSAFVGTVTPAGVVVQFQVGSVVLSASGPSSGAHGVLSAPFAVSLETGASFTGDQSITISDGGAGGTFTPSIGSPSASSVTVTPANLATSFTFTYTPASAGTETLTFSDVQNWSIPAAIRYTAT